MRKIMQKMLVYLLAAFCSSPLVAQQPEKVKQALWQQHVAYSINVVLDDDNHFLYGNIEVAYTNNSPDSLREMYFHLWPNAYKNNNTAFAKQMMENGELDFYYSKPEERGYIDSVDFSITGRKVVLERTKHLDVVRLQWNKPIEPGEIVVISTPFRVKIPKVFSRLGHKNQDYFITQWYPKPAVYDVNGWNPMPYLNQGEFYSEFGSFEVNITLPENYTIAATGTCLTEGELLDEKEGLSESVASSSKQKTVRFEAENVHDFAWFASKRFGYVSKDIKLPNGDVVKARVVAAEPNKRDLHHIETALTTYSTYVGSYPYPHATVVHGELKAGGGMEYPMITLCDFMNEEVIVHEVGHNWFYGILGNNERRYPWMDESINSFYEHLAIHGEDKKERVLSNAGIMQVFAKDLLLRNEYQASNLPSQEYTSNNYGFSVYGLGAKAFQHLKAYLGAERFDECMQQYYEEWKFKHPLPGDMQASFEASTGENLDWFFNGILGNAKPLDYAIKKKDDTYILQNKSNLEMPVPVDFALSGPKETHWFTPKAGESMELSIPQGEIESVTIDADKFTLDSNSSKDAAKHYAIKKKGDTYILKNKSNLEMPVPVDFTLSGPTEIHWFIPKAGESMELSIPQGNIENATFDPNKNTLDLFAGNDALKQKLKVIPFYTGLDKKDQRELFVAPAFGWNAYDRFMLGLLISNHSLMDKKFRLHLAPMYSFNQGDINGHGEISFTQPLSSAGQFVEFGTKLMSYSFEERGLLREQYQFYKVSPFISYNLPKSSLRTSADRSLRLQYDFVGLNPQFEFNDDTLSGPKTFRSKQRNFVTLNYLVEQKRKINGYKLDILAEFGDIAQTVVLGDLNDSRVRGVINDPVTNQSDTLYYFPNIGEEIERDNFIRLSGIFQYNLDIGIKDKPLELRFYGSYLLKDYPNTIYKNSVGSTDGAGYYDYRFDDFLMHRNADVGMFRNQISNRRDFSRFVGPIISSDQWLLNAIITVPLPGKIPIKPYVELLTVNDMDEISYNTGQALFYNVGLEVELIPNRLELFFNLAQSQEITNFQETSSSGIDKFMERATFVIDLNNLTLPKLKRTIKLF
jgi:hypothetical protein